MIEKEVTVSVKLVRDFNSYQITKTWVLQDGEEADDKALLKLLEEEIEQYLTLKVLGGT